MLNAVIAAVARSPFGTANRGSLRDVRADDLAADICRDVISRIPALGPAQFDVVRVGDAVEFGAVIFSIEPE